MRSDEPLEIPTAGLVSDRAPLLFSPGLSRCGTIADGVAFSLPRDGGGWGGGWVIAYEDLERMYLAAKAVRPEGSARPGGSEVREGIVFVCASGKWHESNERYALILPPDQLTESKACRRALDALGCGPHVLLHLYDRAIPAETLDQVEKAFEHLRMCGSCAEDNWNGCDGGREVEAAIEALRAARSEKSR